jgi:PD-(D/E)XK nuclease superfamily protein
MPTNKDVARITANAWRAATSANRQANADHAIHASQLHNCPRALHYRVNAVPHTDATTPEMAIPAHWGTALHAFYLPYLAQQWKTTPGVAEVDIEPVLSLPRRDTGEALIVARPDLRIAFDDGQMGLFELKTTGKAGVDAALAGEPKLAHLDQCRLGALLMEYLCGSPVAGYWIYYLDRADPEHHWALVERAWNDDEATRARSLLDNAVAISADITAAPRWFGRYDADAHAPFSPCQRCPWQSRCLGKDAGEDARAEAGAELVAAVAAARDQIGHGEAALAEFLKLKAGVERARKGKEYLTDLIAHLGLEPGEYALDGVRRTLVWREGHDRADITECVRMLEDLGKAVPKKRTSGFFQIKT